MAAPGASGAILVGGAPATLTSPSWPGVSTASGLTAESGTQTWRVVQASSVANTVYGGRLSLASPINLTDRFLCTGLSITTAVGLGSISNSNPLTEAGIMLALFDGNGNRARWNVGGGNDPNLAHPIVINPASTSSIQASSGVLDVANITAIEIHIKPNSTGSRQALFLRFYSIAFLTLTGGEIGNPASFTNLLNYQNATNQLRVLRPLSDTMIQSWVPIRNQADVFDTASVALEFTENVKLSSLNVKGHFDPGMLQLVYDLPAGAQSNITDSQIKGITRIGGNAILGAGASLSFQSTLIGNTGTRTLVTGESYTGGAISIFQQRTLAGASINGTRFVGGTSNPSLRVNSLGAISRFTATNLAGVIECNLAPGSYPELEATLDAGQIFNITQGTGTYEFVGIEGGTVGNPVVFDNTGGGAVVVVVGAGIAAIADPSPTSGTIALITPVSQIVLSNIPQVTGAIVGVVNLATMAQSFPAITGGVANIPTDPATNYLIAVDAPGWVRQQVVLSGSTPAFTLDWAGRDYRDLYDQGDPLYAGIDLDYSTFAVTVDQSNLLIDPATAFRRIEDLLATPEAIFFPNPPQPLVVELSETVAEYYLVFPYDQTNNVVNPVVIRPHPSNTLDVTLVGFSILLRGAADPFYDIFDFTQQPNGRIIRINTKSTFVQNTVVSGGLSTADREVIDAIALRTVDIPELIEDSDGKRFKAKALEAAPVSSGGGLGPEDIERLERIEQQLIADVRKGRDRYQRLLPGTETIILDQDVIYDPVTGFTLTEHQEPP